MTDAVRDISVREAATAAQAGTVLLLDVLEDDEWVAGHAPTAVHMPLSRLRPATLPTAQPVVAVCRSGNRSAQAASALAAAGLDVVNVAGGMKAWQQAGLPVIAADGHPGTVA